MNINASCVIIGGGINGCSLAYELALAGMKDVIVVEKNFLASGATGRCGGGIRQQWTTPMNIKFAMESVDLFKKLDKEMDYNTEYFQGGYVILAHTEEDEKRFSDNVKLQKEMGLDVNIIEPSEIKKIVPQLNTEDVLCATYCKTDGHANPFYVTQAYAEKAKELGVKFLLNTEVYNIETDKGKISKVITDKGVINTSKVVNAAGGYSHVIASMVNEKIPVRPFRHEILVTEPLNRFFDPMIISFHHGVYFRQELNGGILMGQGDPEEPESFNVESSFPFVCQVARKVTKLMPVLKEISVVRQWAGLYAVTPDAQPILGPGEEIEGLIHIAGFSGHGFMLAPRVAQHIKDYIIHGVISDEIEKLSIKRFKDMELDIDMNVV